MNRENKFRIYDKRFNEYVEDPDYRWMLSRKGKLYNSENDEWHGLGERFIVELYTGLKDKNGKEAYSNDVFTDGKNNWILCQDNLGVWAEMLPERSEWIRDFTPELWKEGCEIIGNIYENPELLKQKDNE